MKDEVKKTHGNYLFHAAEIVILKAALFVLRPEGSAMVIVKGCRIFICAFSYSRSWPQVHDSG